MSEISVKFEGVSAIIAALEKIKGKLDVATYAATKQSGETLQRDARANFKGSHPPGFHHVGGDSPNTVTGNLQRSIIFLNPVLPEGRANYSTRIGPTAIYGRLIELGGHVTPKEAKYLSWFDSQVGVRRFVKEVYVPPYPYFIPARMTLPSRMYQIFKTEWSSAWST